MSLDTWADEAQVLIDLSPVWKMTFNLATAHATGVTVETWEPPCDQSADLPGLSHVVGVLL